MNIEDQRLSSTLGGYYCQFIGVNCKQLRGPARLIQMSITLLLTHTHTNTDTQMCRMLFRTQPHFRTCQLFLSLFNNSWTTVSLRSKYDHSSSRYSRSSILRFSNFELLLQLGNIKLFLCTIYFIYELNSYPFLYFSIALQFACLQSLLHRKYHC